jgi:hypothetical protein
LSSERALAVLSSLSASSLGVFRGSDALTREVSRKQIWALARAGVVERLLPDTYRLTAVACSNEQSLRAALLWAGPDAAAAGRSAAEVYGLEGVASGETRTRRPDRVRPSTP